MPRGGFLLVTVAVMACTACLGDQGKLEIRSSSSGLKASREPVPFRIAEARAHLALGNIALALEGFRKAARDDPASVAALAGIAQCYDQMERFDLSRRHYEMALALAPRDPALLGLFAGSLDKQGLAKEAASVRREMAALPAPMPPAARLARAVPDKSIEAVTVATPPPARPASEVAAPVGPSATIALPPPGPGGAPPAASPRSPRPAVEPGGDSVAIPSPPHHVPPAPRPRPDDGRRGGAGRPVSDNRPAAAGPGRLAARGWPRLPGTGSRAGGTFRDNRFAAAPPRSCREGAGQAGRGIPPAAPRAAVADRSGAHHRQRTALEAGRGAAGSDRCPHCAGPGI